MARRGRVRSLHLGPGSVSAEVVTDEVQFVSLRFAPFSEERWARLVEMAATRLSTAAALFDGELPESWVDQLAASEDIRLLPEPHALDGDCSCPDFRLLCEHAVAVYALIADALDGEPTLLLTLRGWPQGRVEAAVRARWGGRAAVWKDPRDELVLEAPPARVTRSAPPRLDFSLRPAPPAAGLLAVGVPPGGQEVLTALMPLYEAGAKAARDLIEGQGAVPQINFTREEALMGEKSSSQSAPDASEASLSQRIVEVLSSVENIKTRKLSEQLGVGHQKVRAELVALEQLGLVFRTGNTRGTRWWLG